MRGRELLERLFPFSSRRRREAELEDEIRFHLEMAIEENEARGMDPVEARRQAYRSFGGVEQIKEAYRDQQGLPFLDHLGQDLRFALRSLARRPGFCLLAIALLGLGIGGSTAVFSLVHAVVLSPLPGAEPDRVVFIQENLEGRAVGGNPSRLRDWQERLSSFSTFAGFYGESPVLLHRGEPRRIDTLSTFGPYLEAVGVQPSLGRGPTEEEATGRAGKGRGDQRPPVEDDIFQKPGCPRRVFGSG